MRSQADRRDKPDDDKLSSAHAPQPRSLFRWREIPGSVWALGLVSLFMDVSSEMIHALLPLYLVTVLGTSTLTVGIIEGIAEATASITKVFSGALSDYLGKRKWLAALGYGLAAVTKPVFPLASSIGWLVAARFVDRVGKGIRGAPRDALIADLTPADLRGTAFGLRQSLDTIGAVLGPLLAIVFMAAFANNFTDRVLDRGDPGLCLGSDHRVRRARAGTAARPAHRARAAIARRAGAAGLGLLDGRRRGGDLHAGALQRSLPAAARAVGRLAARHRAGR